MKLGKGKLMKIKIRGFSEWIFEREWEWQSEEIECWLLFWGQEDYMIVYCENTICSLINFFREYNFIVGGPNAKAEKTGCS